MGYVSCKEPYEPKIAGDQNNFLVVEGFIVPDTGTTNIYLSRTIGLNQNAPIKENKAIVTVETEAGKSFILVNLGNGTYRIKSLNLGTAKARIKIVAGQDVYYSSFETPLYTSVIDSVSFKQLSDKDVEVYVSTHSNDPNIQRYYYWSYQDTWSFTSQYTSAYYYDPLTEKVYPRLEDIHNCWRTESSTDILIGSSERLSTNVIENFKLLNIPYRSEKLGTKCSIEVKQYSLIKAAWQYWENLKKSTENLGSIFDAQPSLLRGNLYNQNNPNDIIVGYISISKPASKRIFINNAQVKPWSSSLYDIVCIADTALNNEFKAKFAGNGTVPIDRVVNSADITLGYTRTSRKCADCTIHGSNVKPPFWP